MSLHLLDDSDDERDNFDVERQQLQLFERKLLSASFESSEDDEEGIIDGTKIPSSTKNKTRVCHSYLDISSLSSPSRSVDDQKEDDEQNPFDIISKSINLDNKRLTKKKKSLGVPKTRVLLDMTDIYDQDDSQKPACDDPSEKNDEENIDELSIEKKSSKKAKVRKPTKTAILETERKMQQLTRSEQLILPTFVPKPLQTLQALEKRSRQELMNEIRAKNPSFTPQDPELPEIPTVDIESTAVTTLADLTKLIEETPPKPSNTLNILSRFLNPEILKKKPTISNAIKQSNTMIDLTDSKKLSNQPTVKTIINVSLDCIKSPSSSKKLVDLQKQLGIRMQAKRAAMLAENTTNLITEIEDDDEEDNNNVEDSMDTTDESDEEKKSEIVSTINKDNEILQIDEETRHMITDDEDSEEDEEIEIDNDQIDKQKENSNPNRPSLKTILTRMESSHETIMQPSAVEKTGQTEWFNSSHPVQIDSELEMLCSGAFNEENIIPVSQKYSNAAPVSFSPLPPTQMDDDDDDIEIHRPKVRQLIDDDDDEQSKDPESTLDDESENEEDNEELVDYKKQLFEMEAEESGSEIDEKDKEDEINSEDDDEADEELQKFIDTAAVDLDDDEIDDIAKVHLKIKAKEDEHQLKLLKEQYLDFDGDDDGRRIRISKAAYDDEDEDEDEDPDYDNEIEEDDDEDEENPMDIKDRISDLERQRLIQDNQAEELHLNEDLDNIGQHSSMFQKGLALKQKKVQSTIAMNNESMSQVTVNSQNKKPAQTRSVTLSSVLLAKRFSSTLLAPMNKNNIVNSNITNPPEIAAKKQHNPRRHVFATNSNENQNPIQTTTTTSGEKRANSAEKSPKTNIKRFKQTTTTINKESSASVFSALALSNTHQ